MTGLPKITFTFDNGALARTVSSADGLLGICVCGAAEIENTFVLGKPYSIRKTSDLQTLGITAENNALLYQTVINFYAEAPEGTQVYIVGYPSTLTMSAALDKNNTYLRNIIEETKGELRGLIVTKVLGTNPTVTNGLDSDIPAAMMNAQALAEWATTSLYAPLFVILDGLNFSGDPQELADLKQNNYNRVGVVIGTAVEDSPNQAVGFVAGRIANATVDTNIGQVTDGSLNTLTMYAKDKAIELADVETIYDKSYISFRNYTGTAGYFINDDRLATKETDDYGTLTARRTIDKAYRIAYNVLVQLLLGKIQVRADGTIAKPVLVSWQQMVENAIANNMTANDELSEDGDDRGVECFIDPAQNVVSTSRVNIELRVRPFAYARYINVLIGFTLTQV